MAATKKNTRIPAHVAFTAVGQSLSSTKTDTSSVANEYISAERCAMSTYGCAR